FGELDQRLPRPGQKSVELQAAAQRPEMHRQKEGEHRPGKPVEVRHPLAHANTTSTARMPMASRIREKTRSTASRDLSRQRTHSLRTLRRPIGACTATATTNTA